MDPRRSGRVVVRSFTSSGKRFGAAGGVCTIMTLEGLEGMWSEVVGSHHHGGGAQGVAGASEVVPLDAVELPDVVADGVVDTVQVGETTGVKPPT